MSGIERTHLVLQPFQATHVGSDRRRREKEGRAFELGLAEADSEPKMPEIQAEAPTTPVPDEEGVGVHVNIVA